MELIYRIAIDHGFGNIKTPHHGFPREESIVYVDVKYNSLSIAFLQVIKKSKETEQMFGQI